MSTEKVCIIKRRSLFCYMSDPKPCDFNNSLVRGEIPCPEYCKVTGGGGPGGGGFNRMRKIGF